MPRFSSSVSTSSGTRPLTRTAYMPRTYFAKTPSVRGPGSENLLRFTSSLPACYPTGLWIDNRDDAIKVGRSANGNTIWGSFHLSGKCESVKRTTPVSCEATRTCMISSQLGHPFLRKSIGCCMMEHSKHARRCFDLDWEGIVAMMTTCVSKSSHALLHSPQRWPVASDNESTTRAALRVQCPACWTPSTMATMATH